MRRRTILLLCFLIGNAPASAQPDAFARHWPVQIDEPGAYTVTLTPEIYAQIQRADLGDLAAFNADGEPLAFEPSTPPDREKPEPQMREVHWFNLPPTSTGHASDDLLVHFEKTADGSVRLRAESSAPSPPKSGALLIDTGVSEEEKLDLQALVFEFDPVTDDLNARVRIEISDDLESWRTLVADAALLRLLQSGRLLERRRIDLGGRSGRYLRLRRIDEDAPLPFIALQAELRPRVERTSPPPAERRTVESISRDENAFYYRLPSRIPVQRVNVRLARENTAAVVTVSARDQESDPWRNRGTFTVFRYQDAGVELENETLRVSGRPVREWRVEVEGDLAEAPTLEFTYRPERWVLLTQGATPYVIAAGSNRTTREEMPLAPLLKSIRDEYGPDRSLPEATLGEPVVAAGEAAIEASPQERWSNLLLWLVLIGSASALAVMVVRLLREKPNS